MMLSWMWIGLAAASPAYPPEIQAVLEAECVPLCTVCHSTPAGGTGTVGAGFGLAMVDRGLNGVSDLDSLRVALDAIAADGVDSDEDGTDDVDALAANLDPNTGVAVCDVITPVYGCLSHTGGVPGGVAFLLTLGSAFVMRRRDPVVI